MTIIGSAVIIVASRLNTGRYQSATGALVGVLVTMCYGVIHGFYPYYLRMFMHALYIVWGGEGEVPNISYSVGGVVVVVVVVLVTKYLPLYKLSITNLMDEPASVSTDEKMKLSRYLLSGLVVPFLRPI